MERCLLRISSYSVSTTTGVTKSKIIISTKSLELKTLKTFVRRISYPCTSRSEAPACLV
jgi:hypothetical protein